MLHFASYSYSCSWLSGASFLQQNAFPHYLICLFTFLFPVTPLLSNCARPTFPIINQVSLQIRYKLLVANDAALNAFSRKFKTVLSQTLFREPFNRLKSRFSLVGGIIATWPRSHPHWHGVKTCKIFSAQKLEVHFSRTRSCSNKFIGYVDLSDFYEIWPKWSLDIGARKRVGLF